MHRDVSLCTLTGYVVLFTVPGPFVVGLLAPLMLLFEGPFGLLLYPIYFVFWLPSFYVLLAPPFCLTGIIFAAVQCYLSPALPVAVIAALLGFAVTLGMRILLTGSVAVPTPVSLNFGTDAASTIWIIVLVAAATAACWWLVRIRSQILIALRHSLWPRPLRLGADLLLLALTGIAVGGAFILSRPAPPKTAWDRCIDAENLRAEIKDCSTIFDSTSEPAERHLKALKNRTEAYLQLAATAPDPEAIAFYGQAIAGAETAQRLFGTDEHDTLAYSHLHRGQLRAGAGYVSAAMTDFDAVTRIDPEGSNGHQANLERQRLRTTTPSGPAKTDPG